MASHENGVVGEPARSTHCSIDRASCQSHQVPTDCFASLEGFETASAAKEGKPQTGDSLGPHKFVCLSSKGQSKRHSNRWASSYCSRVGFNIIFDNSSLICLRRSSRSFGRDARLILWLPSQCRAVSIRCRSRISCVNREMRSEMSL